MKNFTEDSPFIQERMKVWAKRQENAIGGRLWEDKAPWELEVFNMFDQKCALTRTCIRMTMDHALPRQKGVRGRNGRKNMYPLEFTLNASKNNSHLFKWYEYNKDKYNLSDECFNNLITHLAKENDMTPEEYRSYYDTEYEKYIQYKGGKVRNVRPN